MARLTALLRALMLRFSDSRTRPFVVLGVDGLLAGVNLTVAMLLRFEGTIPGAELSHLPKLVALLIAARIAANAFFRLHRWSFRFAGLPDAMRIGAAGVSGTLLFMAGMFFSQVERPPRSVVVLELLISLVTMVATRFSLRMSTSMLSDWSRRRGGPTVRTVIIGAGAAGEMLLRDLQRSSEHPYEVVGFLDDNRAKWGLVFGGRPVLGGVESLPSVARQEEIKEVLIAMPRVSAQRIREILSLCADSKLRFKILPVSFTYLKDRVSAAMLQDLAPEDLLPREAVSFITSEGAQRVRGRAALVTGAAGSIGSEICRQLLAAGAGRITMVDINENDMYLLMRTFEREFPHAAVRLEVADIRDAKRMRWLFERDRPQDVFHAAAHKHVPLMEWAPCEAVKNNILGTKHVVEAADACHAERFVYISTDKAVRPTSVMGASKRVGEGITRRMAGISATHFCAVRFGNVLGSGGSVVPLFREQIAAGGPVTVTHPEVRRYFMTTSEAVGLVLKAALSNSGEMYVLDMGEQFRIVDLARSMITMSGLVPDEDIRIAYTGLRPGEKLSEDLLTEEEERTSLMTHKIYVVQSPPVRQDLEERIQELDSAAGAEDAARVIALLRQLVPSYDPALPSPWAPEAEASRPVVF